MTYAKGFLTKFSCFDYDLIISEICPKGPVDNYNGI